MYYIIHLVDFTVLRGPFIQQQAAMNVKTVLCFKYPREVLAIVKVDDPEW